MFRKTRKRQEELADDNERGLDSPWMGDGKCKTDCRVRRRRDRLHLRRKLVSGKCFDIVLDQILFELEQAESMGIDEETERGISIMDGGVITLICC